MIYTAMIEGKRAYIEFNYPTIKGIECVKCSIVYDGKTTSLTQPECDSGNILPDTISKMD